MQIWLVGGAVRDEMLGRQVTERDWVVVGATPQAMLDLGYEPVGKDFPVFLHPKTKEEYALARTERKQGRGYHGFDCYAAPDVSLEEDLKRRDLTVNAMARAPDGTLCDPYGGQQDLQDRILRHVSPAFSEDPLRLLRVARFAARYHPLGFSVAEETMALMREIADSGELQWLSPERIWTECNKALETSAPQVFFRILNECGAASECFQSLAAAFSANALQRVEQAADADLSASQRWAALCLDADPEALMQTQKALKIPNKFQDAARLGAQFWPLPWPDNGATMLQALQQFDWLRRPERLQDFLETAAALGTNPAIIECWQDCAKHSADIDAKALQAQGLKGAEIGLALQQQRQAIIEQRIQQR